MGTKDRQIRLYQRVSDDLASRIRAGDFQPGDRLPAERVIAQTYGVSRPTVREAVIALEVDGLVDVRMGSGVFVRADIGREAQPAQPDVGPFELLEARRVIEGEACALAAMRITDAEIEELAGLLTEMQEHAHDIDRSEQADRRFHEVIAGATQNSALAAAVVGLWDARERSPQYRLMTGKAHAAGIVPRLDEHVAILEALRTRDGLQARAQMQGHITRVLESMMEATEVHEVEQARARVAAQRSRYRAIT